MYWSNTYISTLRDDPQEAEIPSHKLMLRAGLIRRLSGGLYTYMPMGLRALRKVESIVREEMDRAGGIEVLMPAMQPREIWETSGRADILEGVMFQITDRQDRAMVLGPTHEEVITDLISREINTYRQLPRTFYQIQTKFRDEIRPRFGLMRAKEFIMKDAYSFDVSWDAADASYQAMYDAYVRIFERCGLNARAVEADTGAMGGNCSHEFMVLTDAGEDAIVECASCEYAANTERAERRIPSRSTSHSEALEPMSTVSTPNQRTIEDVSTFLDIPAERMIKTLIFNADGKPVAALVPGDRDVCEQKLAQLVGAKNFEAADEAMVKNATGAPVGFAGPINLDVPLFADRSLEGLCDGITGANQKDLHYCNVSIERDTTIQTFHDIVLVKSGDGCPRCDTGTLSERRGVEVGHVFKLGTKYAEAFGATFLDEGGDLQTLTMGCYGIGISRTLQSAIEQCHDENGIVWPSALAPFQVAILILKNDHEASCEAAASLCEELEAMGIDVIVDDRKERPGVKFKDSDLLGFPVRVVVSERSLAGDEFEVKLRTASDPVMISVAGAANSIKDLLP